MGDKEIREQVSKGKAYTLVLLLKGNNRTSDKEAAEKLQMEHLRYLFKLREEGKLLLNGPLKCDNDLRGIGIFASTDLDEVRKLAEEDPAVKAGSIRIEVYPWFGLPGDCLT
jgi:uncharacterized protein YciI